MGFIEGFVNGFTQAVTPRGIEGMLRELGWSVDERKGTAIGLYFKCPVVSRRTVYIIGWQPLVLFGAYSEASFSMRQVPEDAISFALVHNEKCALGKWEMEVDGEDVKFRLTYNALAGGLDAAVLKEICMEFVETAGTFDRWLMKKGFLR